MVWHFLGASTILAVLKWRRIAGLWHEHSGLNSRRSKGFAFATAYALAVVPVSLALFRNGNPVPRFNDIFLIGIALTAYFFTWEPAAYLLAISVIASAWLLPPHGTLAVQGFAEWYRLVSFAAVSAFVMVLLTRMKTRQQD